MNIVCKRGYFDVFKTLIECGASIKTCDQSNRTPLHFAAPNPCFELVEKILELDVNMLNSKDSFGKTPLEYVTDEIHSAQWRHYLLLKQTLFCSLKGDNYTTNSNVQQVLVEDEDNDNRVVNVPTPSLSDQEEDITKNEVLPNPVNALSEKDAKMVSSGQIVINNKK